MVSGNESHSSFLLDGFCSLCFCTDYSYRSCFPCSSVWTIQYLERAHSRCRLTLFSLRFNLTWYLELPWFGEAPGYYNTAATGVNPVYPVMGQYPGGVHPQIQPGSALVVQPGVNGQLPTITQIPIASNVWTNKAVMIWWTNQLLCAFA